MPKQRFNKRVLLRKLFNSYFIGDRVKIPDYDRTGTIVKKFWVPGDAFDSNPHWEYEVEFDHVMRLEFYPPDKSRCGGMASLHFEDLELVK